MSETRIPVKQVALAPDAAIIKIEGSHGTLFSIPILYHLDDGRIVAATYRAQRKKDVVAYRNQLPLIPTNPAIEALFDGDEFWATATVWDLRH